MTAPKILYRGSGDGAQQSSSRAARLRILPALPAIAAVAVALVAYSSGPTAAAAATRTAQGGVTESSLVHHLDTCLPAGQARPVVVLVHGAWADASSWSGEVATLQAAGYDVRAIANPLQDLTTDSQYVADYLKTIPGPVVLVGHSYGGAVITNAAAGLANVKALVYVDAAAPAPGETNGQLSGASSILTKDTPAQLFFTTSDLPRAEAEQLWASQRGASTAAFGTPSRYAAWKTIPSWYFISSGDQIITAASELAMAHRAHSHITVFHGGSHLTLISHPDAVTAVIASAICSLR
jgi:pimeloyl-ACP methyl ester carboxylesterase